MAGLIILALVLLGGWAIYCFLEYALRQKEQPRLYLVLEEAGDNLEWLIRHICHRAGNWRLIAVYGQNDESRRILEKLSRRFGFELRDKLIYDGDAYLYLNNHTTTAEISQKLKNLNEAQPGGGGKKLMRDDSRG